MTLFDIEEVSLKEFSGTTKRDACQVRTTQLNWTFDVRERCIAFETGMQIIAPLLMQLPNFNSPRVVIHLHDEFFSCNDRLSSSLFHFNLRSTHLFHPPSTLLRPTPIMLQALRQASKRCSPPPRLAQVLIVGTEHARTALSPQFSRPLRHAQSALTCDIASLRHICKHPTWRYVAVVTNVAELRRIMRLLESPKSSNFVVVVMSKCEHTICAVRITALEAGGVGVVAGAPSLLLVHAVLEAWVGKEIVDEDDVKRAFGEAKLGKDVVVPPGWDTEGKIRAVIDSLGLDYDQLGRLGIQEMEEENEPSPKDDAKLNERAKETKLRFLQEHQDWLNRIGERIEAERNSVVGTPAKDVDGTVGTEFREEKPVESDFFQKLLSGGK